MIERDEVFRIKTAKTPGTLARVLAAIATYDAHIGEITTISVAQDFNIREVVVIAPNDEAVPQIARAIAGLSGVELIGDHFDRVFDIHRGGKLRISPTVDVRTIQDMREVYTPGVGRVSAAIADYPGLANEYTWRSKTVAIVSDGSRVLGLGNIGPIAALPVMEGKALFYSMFVGMNAVPIMIGTQDPEEIIETVVNIAPGFAGIHLEDIASPGVYHIEAELEERLGIPVLHDDQHGTAVVVIAAALSAATELERDLSELTFGQIGLGAAGSAIARLATEFPFKRIVAFDPGQDAVDRLMSLTDDDRVSATSGTAGMQEVSAAADILVLATGRGGLLPPDMVTEGQVIMALSNPEPEITREAAKRAGARIATDGTIANNVLAYPGLFRGTLDGRAPRITWAMKRAAALALTELAPPGELLPDALDVSVHTKVASRVAIAAR